MLASAAASNAGTVMGFGILVAVGVGLTRTFTRKDLTRREKLLGKRRSQ